MATNRLKLTFYAFNTGTGSGNNIKYKTYLPYYTDPNYNIPVPLSYAAGLNYLTNIKGLSQTDAKEKLASSTGEFSPFQSDYTDYSFITRWGGGFSSNEWFATISINGEMIAPLSSLGSNSAKYAGIKNIFFGNDTMGYNCVTLEVNVSITGAIPPDAVVEITLVCAKSYAPWIYYGNIAQRSDLATRLGRSEKAMGGIPLSLTPADAMQIKYYIEGNTDVFFAFQQTPYWLSNLITDQYQMSSTNENFSFMFDFINATDAVDKDGNDCFGDEQVAIRTLTNFNISGISLGGTPGGNSVSLINSDLTAAAFQNTHYRYLAYNNKSVHLDNSTISKVTYFIACENNISFKDFYSRFVDNKNFLLKYFSDESKSDVEFYFYTFASSSVIPAKETDLPSVGTADGKTKSLTDVINILVGNITSIISADKDKKNVRDYNLIFLSKFDWEIKDTMFEGLKTDTTIPDRESSKTSVKDISILVGDTVVPLNVFAGVIVTKDFYNKTFTNTLKNNIISPLKDFCLENAKYVFGEKNVVQLCEMWDGGILGFLFQQLQLLTQHLEDIFSVYSIDGGKQFCVDIADIISSTKFVIDDISAKDISNGYSTNLDRIFDLYKKINPQQNVENSGYFLKDIRSEMTMWRELCPIGQLYKISGYISKIVDNGDGSCSFNFCNTKDTDIVDSRDTSVIERAGIIDSKNTIRVIAESGVKVNSSNFAEGDYVEIQGQILYSPYFIDKKIITNSGYMDFNVDSEIIKYYRINENTLSLIRSFNIPTPILIARSNYYVIGGGSFSEAAEAPNRSTMIGTIDHCEDYIYKIEQDTTETIDVKYKLSKSEEKEIVLFENGSNINLPFLSMSFDLIFPNAIDISSGLYKYYLSYVKPGETKERRIFDFYSKIGLSKNKYCTNTNGVNKFININISDEIVLKCLKRTKDVDINDVGKIFDICYQYSSNTEGERLLFKWDSSIYAIRSINRAQKNITTYGLSINGTGYDYTIYPSEGKLVLKTAMDKKSKDSISMNLVNISQLDNPSSYSASTFFPYTKIFKLYIKREDDTLDDINSPTITNVKINYGVSKSLEKVEGVFFDGNSSEHKHYICPTYGFIYVSGSGSWYYDDQTSHGSTTIQGYMMSPYFYYDAFADGSDMSLKQITYSSTNLAAIGRVFGTVAASTQPLVYISALTVPVISVAKVTYKMGAYYSEIFNKCTLLYIDKDSIFNLKESFTDFVSRYDVGDRKEGQIWSFRDSENNIWMKKNLRYNYPLYCEVPKSIKLSSFRGLDKEFDISSVVGSVVGLYFPTLSEIASSQELEVYSGSDPFGYTAPYRSSYITAPHRISVMKDKSYSKLPNTTGISNFTIKKPDDFQYTNYIVSELFAHYVTELQKGSTPQLLETSNGDYIIFYLGGANNSITSNNQIKMLISSDDGYTWSRPYLNKGAKNPVSQKPICILENKSGFSDLVYVNSLESDSIELMYWDEDQRGIQKLNLPKNILTYIYYGCDDDDVKASDSFVLTDDMLKIVKNSSSVLEPYFGKDMPDNYAIVKNWKIALTDTKDIAKSNTNLIKSVLNGTNYNFSAIRGSDGTIYLAYLSSGDNSSIRILYSGTSETSGDSSWTDTGFVFSSSDSYLGKYLANMSINYMTISLDTKTDDNLYLFVSTDNSLVCLPIPSVLLYYLLEGKDKKDYSSEIQNIIDEINSVKPVLLIGKDEDNPRDNLNKELFLNEEFIPQMISVLWLSDGSCSVFFYDKNKNVTSIKSRDLVSWTRHKNV